MNTSTSERTSLVAEQSQVRAALAALPANAALTRRSLESRLRVLDDALAALPAAGHTPARARLTFSGRPVFGSHGVFAAFGTEALARFSEAVAAAAASLSAPLAAVGPIPGRDRNQLLITGTAVGSFGFELEEVLREPPALDTQTPMAQALEHAQRLLKDAAEADDEHLADTVAELDGRAVAKVRDFVNLLAEHEAVCTLVVGDHGFRFTDAGQVRRCLARLSARNMVEQEATLEGRFEGVIPARRTFEFHAGQEVLVGKIGAGVDPGQLKRLLDQLVRVQVLITRVGTGRPRYTLLAAPTLPASAAPPAV